MHISIYDYFLSILFPIHIFHVCFHCVLSLYHKINCVIDKSNQSKPKCTPICKNQKCVHRNISGIHRRLLDGSSRQLIILNATSPEENHVSATGEQININSVTANTTTTTTNTTATNVSNSTTSLASNPSSSLSAISSSANNTQLINSNATTTFLTSTSTYPMASPSSCLAIRRPSANMFVQFSWLIFSPKNERQLYRVACIQ